ncbi:hypothetical protein NMY22_g7626 [Coprinellus aureogranulatus]|nr:hypothetical protein NMY22_g7626 [Coprinellus aureogranulatus]
MLSKLSALLLCVSLTIASPALNVRQSPTIKQTVGTWQYKGCYKDFGPRILTFRFDVPAGNNAERCTALCASKGYGLAGMEYGCDNYLPYGNLMPDSECNFPCPGDGTELCGAGNRMVVYQDSAATPPSTSACINWRDGFSFGNNVLYAIPKTAGGGPTTKLYAIPTNPFTDPIFTLSSRYNNQVLPPVVGDSQAFIATWPISVTPYNQFCVKPNPLASNPFIGHPVLSVNGHTDLWGLCANTTANGRLDIIYSPVANHPHYVKSECQDVYVEVTPYA